MMKCPSCQVPLCRLEYEGVPIHVCPDCRGSLVDAQRFRAIERRRERTWTDEEKSGIAASVARTGPSRSVRCPGCLAKMAHLSVPMGGSAFRIGFCGSCNLLWFDRGEMDLAQILYEKEQDSLTAEERERVAGAALRRLPVREERPTLPPPAYSPTVPPTGAYFGEDLAALGYAEYVVELLIASGLHIDRW
jgi:Zn-finger nucleic acid-binding protein